VARALRTNPSCPLAFEPHRRGERSGFERIGQQKRAVYARGQGPLSAMLCFIQNGDFGFGRRLEYRFDKEPARGGGPSGYWACAVVVLRRGLSPNSLDSPFRDCSPAGTQTRVAGKILKLAGTTGICRSRKALSLEEYFATSVRFARQEGFCGISGTQDIYEKAKTSTPMDFGTH